MPHPTSALDGDSLPSERKKAQRAEIRRRLATLSDESRSLLSDAIGARLERIAAWRNARTVALYAPLRFEPSPPWPAPPEGLGRPVRRVAFPRISPEFSSIELRQAESPASLIPGHASRGWTLIEPPASAPLVADAEIDVALVPGIAFDRSGRRLGRGGGYYDRLLARLPATALRIGVFFSVQELDEVCEETHDRRLDLIVTENELIEIPGGKPASTPLSKVDLPGEKT